MARKDVELVIRAKDEVTKTVDAVTGAIQQLVGSQEELSKSADKTGGVLGNLGKAFGDLQKVLKTVSSADALAKNVKAAADSMARLEADAARAAAENEQFQASARQAAQETERLTNEVKALDAALKAQGSTVDGLKSKQDALTVRLREATLERSKLATAEKNLPTQIEKTTASLEKSIARYEKQAAAVAAAEKPSKTMVETLRKFGEQVENKKAKLDGLNAALAATKVRAAEVTGTVGALEAEFAGVAAEIERETKALNEGRDAYKGLADAAKASARTQKDLEEAADRSASALERANVALDKGKTNLEAFRASTAEAQAALDKLGQKARGALLKTFGDTKQDVDAASTSWAVAEQRVRELAAAMNIIGPPTREMAEGFARAKLEAGAAKEVYEAQVLALHRMRQAIREAGDDVDKMAAAQRKIEQASKALVVEIGRIQAAYAAQASASSRAGAEAGKAATQTTALGRAARTTAQAMQQADQESLNFAAALRSIYGESRQAMSWTQRLRGEVLSLITAYVGIYGVIQGLRSVVDATNQVTAATNKLNVAFGTESRAAEELDFIRRQAQRLGIEFGTLANEYGKFALATQNTPLEGENTRKIFVAVAEAARVANLSIEDVKGVMTALGQIASKGAVQMEELRQQLGDRLPGAIQLMADGLGVGTDELIKMMEQGMVTSEALIGFADQLQKKYSGQLAKALESLNAQLGFLQNTIFNTLLRFGEAGFIDSFTNLIQKLNEALESPNGREAVEKLSAAISFLIDVLAKAVENWDLLVIAATSFIGLRIATAINLAWAAFVKWRTAAIATEAAVAATAGAAGTLATGATTAARAITVLRGAMTLLMSSTGIGLLVTAIGTGIGYWITQADDATKAMTAHEKIVNAVKNAYDKSSGSVEDWAKKIEDVTLTQAQASLLALKESLKDVQESLSLGGVSRGQFVDPQDAVRARDLAKAFKEGRLEAEDFKAQIDELAQANPDFAETAAGWLDYADNVKVAEEAVATAEAVIRVLTGTATDADKAILGLGTAAEEMGKGFGAGSEAAADFQEKLDALKALVPDLAREMKYLKDLSELDTAFFGLGSPQTVEQLRLALDYITRARRALKEDFLDDTVSGSIVDKIIGVESGGNANAKNPGSSATGLGQFIESTWLRMFKQYFPDRAAGLSDAMILELRKDRELSRKMVELYVRENAKVLQEAGVALTDANLYLAHFLGANDAKKVALANPQTSLEGLINSKSIAANPSVFNDVKTAGELVAWAEKKVGLSKVELDLLEGMQKADDERLEKATEYTEGYKERIALLKDEVANNGQMSREMFIQQALAKETELAKKAGLELTKAQTDEITTLAGKEYDLKNAVTETKDARAAANAELSKANGLYTLLQAQEKQLDQALASGDPTAIQAAQAALDGTRESLNATIDSAIAMWQAIGGSQAEGAIAKLEALRIKSAEVATSTYLDWERIGDLFASGLTNAFDQFAQAVAEGADIGEAARKAFLQFASDFLRQIAQMIIKQAILNALRSFAPGLFGAGVAHSGGIAGASNRRRMVNPAIFANAMRLHGGGIPGLKANEVPTILERNEEVLTRSDPRHILNGGGASGEGARSPVNVRALNFFDLETLYAEMRNSRVSEESILNVVSNNPAAFNAALGK